MHTSRRSNLHHAPNLCTLRHLLAALLIAPLSALAAPVSVSDYTVIEAEDYHEYFDTTSGNSGWSYRWDDVDIEPSTAPSGFNVSAIVAGEFLLWEIDVARAGIYRVEANIASLSNSATMRLNVNDVQSWTLTLGPTTNDWQLWETRSIDIRLPAGRSNLSTHFESAGFNFDRLALTLIAADDDIPDEGNDSPTPITISANSAVTIEAEDYHDYYDRSPGNSGGLYRDDDVDIEYASAGGYNVGWIESGEWLAWEIDVESAGEYELSAQVASDWRSILLRVKLDDVDIASLSRRSTGYAQRWRSTSSSLLLPAGRHTLKLEAASSEFNLDRIALRLLEAQQEHSPTPSPTPTPIASPIPTPSPSPSPSPIPSPLPSPVVTPSPVPSPTATVLPSPSAVPTPLPTPSPTTLPTPSPEPSPVAERLPNDSCVPPDPIEEPGSIRVERAFPQLAPMAAPLAMVQAAADSTFWFAIERAGRVLRFDNRSDATGVSTVLDLRARVATTLEMGLTGIAFHPRYPSDPRIFLLYNDSSANGRSTLVSYRVNPTTRNIDSGSARTLLTLDQPGPNHNGGDLAFGSDGYLYAGFGDGGESYTDGNPQYAQQRQNLLGSVIRIDINTEPYAVPADNPFNSGQALCGNGRSPNAGICPEIYAYGLRNPWRISIDRVTGALWVGDVGEDDLEEVNRIEAGGNYGWPMMEGSRCLSGSCAGLRQPVAEYGRDQGSSVVGGYVYRGSRSPNLYGRYLFGDVFSGRFFSIDANSGGVLRPEAAFTSGRTIYAMAEDAAGEIYLLNPNAERAGDNIYRVVGSGGQRYPMPERLSATGCFDTQSKSSARGVVDYDITSPLWSDGAAKQRAFALPNESRIEVLADGDFRFPVGSVLVKHFLQGERYLETRLLIHFDSGWQGFSYEWNEAQTDASLLSGGKSKDVGDFVHQYPSRAQCNTCHTSAAHGSLGIELAQLNRYASGMNANIIDYLSSAGYFTAPQYSRESPTLYALRDTEAGLADRARSYLHSNCSGCHRPGALSGMMDLRFGTPFADTGTCNVDASVSNLGIPGARRIEPGHPERSILLLRMQSLVTGERMPPLGTSRVDEEAVQVVRDWIAGMGGCE